MMKKISDLDAHMLDMGGDEDVPDKMPTRRGILRMLGNVKSDTADNARRVARIIGKVRDKKNVDLILENDDMNFLLKRFEENPMDLVAWMHGQILELIDGADKVEPPKKD